MICIRLQTQFLSKGKSVSINYDFEINDLFLFATVPKIILVNLISILMKYSKPNETSIVKASLKSDKEYVFISVEDNGVGTDLQNSQKKTIQYL